MNCWGFRIADIKAAQLQLPSDYHPRLAIKSCYVTQIRCDLADPFGSHVMDKVA